MGTFMSRLPCGGTLIQPDKGEPSFQTCDNEHCIHCGSSRKFAAKFRKHVLLWLLPHDGWGKKARTTFGVHPVANRILAGNDVSITRNHNITGDKGWYNINGEITLQFSVLVTDTELVKLQKLWVEAGNLVHPVDQNLNHPNAPKGE